jgi:hypothetical protein
MLKASARQALPNRNRHVFRGKIGSQVKHPPAVGGGRARGQESTKLVPLAGGSAANQERCAGLHRESSGKNAQEGPDDLRGEVLVGHPQTSFLPALANRLEKGGDHLLEHRRFAQDDAGALQGAVERRGIESLGRGQALVEQPASGNIEGRLAFSGWKGHRSPGEANRGARRHRAWRSGGCCGRRGWRAAEE